MVATSNQGVNYVAENGRGIYLTFVSAYGLGMKAAPLSKYRAVVIR